MEAIILPMTCICLDDVMVLLIDYKSINIVLFFNIFCVMPLSLYTLCIHFESVYSTAIGFCHQDPSSFTEWIEKYFFYNFWTELYTFGAIFFLIYLWNTLAGPTVPGDSSVRRILATDSISLRDIRVFKHPVFFCMNFDRLHL